MQDRPNPLLAPALIALVMLAWFMWLRPATNPAPPPVTASADSAATLATKPRPADSLLADTTLGPAARGTGRLVTVQADDYTAVLSTEGASIRSFKLARYTRGDRRTPVELVDSAAAPRGALGVTFFSPTGRKVDTRSLYFDGPADGAPLRLTGDSLEVPFMARMAGGTLRLVYVFRPNYEVDLRVEAANSAAFMAPDGYALAWTGAIPFSEESRHEEVLRSAASARSGGELEMLSLASDSTHAPIRLTGDVTWTIVKNKYFAAALFPQRPTSGAALTGQRFGDPKTNARLAFSQTLDFPALQDGRSDRVRMFLGPLSPSLLARYPGDAFDAVDLGWDWMEVITRPFAKYILSPYFSVAGAFLKNYGLVLILLAFFVKLATHPLTRSQTRSMAKMRDLQPKMEALKERYANDPQQQQLAMMQLYKEAGANPLGGCLPMLIQYPFLIALWQYIPQSIALRQEPFLWAKDLSAPDAILHLPFGLPIYGNFVAGFALLMTLSMVAQMKLTMKNQPQNDQTRIMTAIMPVMLLLFFNQQAAGLSLYYLFYNVFSAAEQWWLRRSTPAMSNDATVRVGGAAVATPAAGPRSTPPKRKLAPGQNN